MLKSERRHATSRPALINLAIWKSVHSSIVLCKPIYQMHSTIEILLCPVKKYKHYAQKSSGFGFHCALLVFMSLNGRGASSQAVRKTLNSVT